MVVFTLTVPVAGWVDNWLQILYSA